MWNCFGRFQSDCVTVACLRAADRACRPCSWRWKSGAEDHWELGGVESGLRVSPSHPEEHRGCGHKPCCQDNQTAERYWWQPIIQSRSKLVSLHIFIQHTFVLIISFFPWFLENCFHSFLLSWPVPTYKLLSGDWGQLGLKAEEAAAVCPHFAGTRVLFTSRLLEAQRQWAAAVAALVTHSCMRV